MKVAFRRLLPLAALAVILALASGCAKKSQEAPPQPPPAPPVATRDTTPPAPPVEAPVTPPAFSSSDLKPAFFDFDSYSLRDDARTALDGDAGMLRDHASVNITIEGHADERGTDEYNQALGEKRAQSARDYLVGAGIAAARIQVVSYGKERPFADGHDESAWAQNRRAHLVIR
jgi:peptidoglycan-associated lipoprotein